MFPDRVAGGRHIDCNPTELLSAVSTFVWQIAPMDMIVVAGLAVLAVIWLGTLWYARWCRDNGVPEPASDLELSLDGDGGGD